jgi:ligand-binding sensor domain-containing protein
MKKIILPILVLLASYLLNAQGSVTLISKENSKLPENDIWSIAVDHSGNKWFGTAKSGLVKYNNVETKIFSPGNSVIKGDHIGPLFVDLNGTLWVSTSNPGELFTVRNDSIKKITNQFIEALGGVIAIAQNKKGEIYFGGANAVIKFDGTVWSKVKLPLDNVTVRTIDINPNNTIAIGHNDGLLIGSEQSWQVFKEEKDKLQLAVVRAVKFISDTTLIIGYGGGFGNGGFSVKNGKQWTHYNKTNSAITDHMVRDIEVDEKGNYWMATNNGLIKFTSRGELKPILFREGMFKNTILDIRIENNSIWIATNFGVIKLTE